MIRSALIGLLFWAGLSTAHADPLLWIAHDDDSRVYLAGSLHLMPADAYPLDPAFEKAYQDTRRLVLETDLTALESPANQTRLVLAAQADDEQNLRQRIGPTLYAQVRRHAERLGLPILTMDSLKPWFIGLMLELLVYQEAGFAPQYGLDQYFSQRAIADAKPVLGLETVDEHLNVLTGLADGPESLAATLSQMDEADDLPVAIYQAWKDGDMSAFENLVETMRLEHPSVHKRLLADRNHRWVNELQALLAGSEDVLVIVGAAHMPGQDGLLQLLDDAGMRMVRVAN